MMVTAVAPVRVADLGGWTDTWFARTGAVLNIAVEPGVEVEARLLQDGGTVRVRAESFGDDYGYDEAPPGRHPLIEAAVEAARPAGSAGLDLRIRSAMPPGAGTGTSAAVIVAVLGAIDALAGRHRAPIDLAMAARRGEVDRAGREAGLQDHVAAAHGGVSFIDIPSYPEARVERILLAPGVARALDDGLVLVYLGRAHHSSDVHRAVIDRLRATTGRSALARLRAAAGAGRDALAAGDLQAFGRALIANSDAQRDLHPGLVSSDASAVFELARRAGAFGWKVNGAGGDGGSVTVLAAPDSRAELTAAVLAALPAARVIPVTLAARGCRVRASVV